ncbi:MAG: BMP family ABC transporter substrate-binding protein [Oscillospiraceae bacterium]|nr:BMP family ABC transporter substrate-binding protein [Oscillospiraceae bacterium]
MKKLLSLILAAVMMFGCVSVLSSCDSDDGVFKVGFIFLHDETSTYDKNFIDAALEATEKLGLDESQVIFKKEIPEGAACYDEAVDLVDQGCDVIFADSFGHEEWMIKAAKEFPDVEFCHATGVKAHTEKLPNYHNAFASIYEGRYLAGIAAGMKLNEMITSGDITAEEAVMGYVGAFPYAEVISGYSSFYLGAKSVCPSVTMLVDFTGSWYSPEGEANTANALIDKGAVLISQHADSMGAPGVCETRNVPNVFYNGTTISTCPNTYLIASRINWAPFFEYMITSTQNETDMPYDWFGSLNTDSVKVVDMNTAVAAEGTKEAIDTAMAELKAGTRHVFDTNNFTVGGEKVTTYLADVDDAGDYVGETEVIENGVFYESKHRSAPYFDLPIDGITRLDK